MYILFLIRYLTIPKDSLDILKLSYNCIFFFMIKTKLYHLRY